MAFHFVAFCLFQLAPRFSPIWVDVCLLVAPYIVELGQNKQYNTKRRQPKQNLVPCAVERFVFVAVNLFMSVSMYSSPRRQTEKRTHVIRDDTRCLNRHIIHRCCDGSRPDRASISRRDSHESRMNIWRSNQQNQIDPSSPITGIRGQDLKNNQQSQAPKLRGNPNQEPLIEPLRYPRTEHQVDDENDIRGDSQQIGFESAKAHALQLDSDVVCRWRVGNHPDQTQEVNRPHVVVAQRVPEHLGGDSLAIMHASLAGVVAEHPVDHDLLLVLVEPAVLATEPAFGLCRGCWHPEHRDDANHAGDEAFEGKEIAPAASAVTVAHMQKAKGKECANDRGGLV